MPLDDEYGPQIWSSNADLCNVSTTLPIFLPIAFDTIGICLLDRRLGRGILHSSLVLEGMGCKNNAALVDIGLQAFVEGIEAKDGKEASLRWAHIDIAVRTLSSCIIHKTNI